ncbi:MAG: hypothetical protein AB4426_08710 [Xenococcaceae cyanobacterium]
MPKISKSKLIFWFSFSLTFAVIFGICGLRQVFQGAYTVQDDARQHVFWMQRFIDPELFPQDIIADYFQSVAPRGYSSLYSLFASIGVEPFLFNKLLPLILGIIATAYCFGVCIQIFPVPFAGFISTLLLNQNLWLGEDLSSGTPRAFIYPLLLAFLYYLLKRSLLPCLVTIVLQGLFYPHTVLISAGVLFLQIFSWQDRLPKINKKESNYFFCCTGLATALLSLLPYALKTSEFGSVITVSEARALPEFLSQGRTAFFLDNPLVFWLSAERSGIFPREWKYILLFCFGCLLPILQRCPSRFPLAQKINGKVIVLLQILLASLAMFFLAHVLLFKFHLPSRYTQHTLRILIALADGIFITVVLDSVYQWIGKRIKKYFPTQKYIVRGLIGILAIASILYPSYAARLYPQRLGYLKGEASSLYQFFSQQPKESLVASLTREADFIPTFSKRSVLVSKEYSIPYHTGYYEQLRQRNTDMIRAQYTQNLEEVKDFIEKYGIDFWLLEKDAFKPEYVENNNWIMQFQPAATKAIEEMKQGNLSALSKLTAQCTVFEDKDFIVLQGRCIKSHS